jgi:tRNA A-37 threonylcarbamoyl transferase component Bud32
MVDERLAGGRSAARGSRFLLVAPRSSYPSTVSAHLATCPNCKGEMDVTDVGPYTRVRCPGCGEEVRVKTEMGPYRLVRRIAIGGMSVVFVARDPTLDREIAVKVLSEECSANEKRENEFKREAKLTATVSHPNVVRVFTVGRAFGRFFIAMELVSGQSLEGRMSVHGALPEQEVIALALQVVDGLRAANSGGLIHRDIKPGNILIDESGTAKIVDFGLSLLTEDGAVRPDELWATPYYVPPETLNHVEEDHRADFYALGATLYHALAGVPPIDDRVMSTRVLREAKQNVTPLKKVAPWLSSAVVRTVEQAMEHDPADRFESYDDFIISLETARTILEKRGAHVPVHGAIRTQRRERQVAHRKTWVLAGGGLILALLTALGFLIGKMQQDKTGDEETKGPGPVILPGSDPNLDPETAMAINGAYEGARQALADDDFVVAEEQFLRVWNHEKAPTQTAAWAGFEAAVAAYLDGRSGDARQHLADLYDFVNSRRAADTLLGRRLHATAELLTDLSFVPEDRIPIVLEDPFRATTFLAMALKTWEQGQLKRANSMFERFVAAGPWGDAEWMAVYQQLASRYLRDYRELGRADRSIEGKNRVQLQESIEALDELYTSLRTRGRARFNVKVWQTDLLRKLRFLKNRRVAPQWREFREEVARDYLAEVRFAEAAAVFKAAKLEGEVDRHQRTALIFLCEASEQFLHDLTATLGPGANGVDVTTRRGTRFTQIIGSQKGGFMVEKNGAARSLTWKEIEPLSLLLLHRIMIEVSENERQKEARLLQSAAFAWLNDLKPEAGGIAEELIALKPSFAVTWELMMDCLGVE